MEYEGAIQLLTEFKESLQKEKRVIEADDGNVYARNYQYKLPLLQEQIKGLEFAIGILKYDADCETE